ncbi:transposase family protein [Dehalobacter sp. DCM]|uniref:Mu transposase C-terminal domain-containing protein n=1 Tax=Dehalobacter sp. DCM TaxID=2907827 RepID=UPI0030812F3D|nr:transposase family protein [Dehalobacter sp. DCM]
MKIHVNTVLQNIKSAGKMRIIWVSPGYSYAYSIPLESGLKLPNTIRISELEEAINNNLIREINDPYLQFLDEDSIKPSDKEKRDNEWKIADYLWNAIEPKVLFRNYRQSSLEDAATKFNVPVYKVQRIMIRFWQRGMTKNALLPDYSNSGARGKSRNCTEKKRGRPPKVRLGGVIVNGINVDNNIKEIFQTSVDRYYNSKTTITDVYEIMKDHYFSDKYIIGKETKYKRWDENLTPTYNQFNYWFKNNIKIEYRSTKSRGENFFLTHYRELLGNSNMETFGPGWRYEIDATIADIYLLNRERRRIIGRPVVYVIIDVFSRLIVGFNVTLEGPSWLAALVAIDSILEDKVELCKKYGILINPSEWPNSLLSTIFLVDNGEFKGIQSERLTSNMGIRVEFAPPYRGDLKGIVERYFRTLNSRIIRLSPGAVEKEFREVREARANHHHDYRLDATLTMDDFTKLMIDSILLHNKKVISDYPLDTEMYSHEIEPTPINLWNWGLSRKTVGFKKCDRDNLRLNTLPVDIANITREGIKFHKDLFYSSEKAIAEQWFIDRTQEKIKIVYDPRKLSNIYIPDAKWKSYTTCSLLPKCKEFSEWSLDELLFNQDLMRQLQKASYSEQSQMIADRESEGRRIISNAKMLTNNVKKEFPEESKKARLSNIQQNRVEEKELIRKEEAFTLARTNRYDDKAPVLQINVIDEELQEENLNLLNRLRNKKDEYQGDKK